MIDRCDELAAETEGIYIGKLRAMSCLERLEAAVGLSEAVMELAIAGIRHDHPGISDAEIKAELCKRTYG